MDIKPVEVTPGKSRKQKESSLPSCSNYGYETGVPRKGKYIDEWGSIRHVSEDGVTGEVKEPVLKDLSNLDKFEAPWDFLESIDLSCVNKQCEETDQFMLSRVCARPFERMQFIRGTENLFRDIIHKKDEVLKLCDIVHKYNLEHIKMWLETDVDGVWMMDDWGSQNNLLISPDLWGEIFKPLYQEYCELIHESEKYAFFHSDGWIEEIYPDLIEVGFDAINSQLFCMNIERLAEKYRGSITFWGEIDRQRILPLGTPDEVREAVFRVRRALDDGNGGVIAQCEWGKNNPVENIEAVFEAWQEPLEE